MFQCATVRPLLGSWHKTGPTNNHRERARTSPLLTNPPDAIAAGDSERQEPSNDVHWHPASRRRRHRHRARDGNRLGLSLAPLAAADPPPLARAEAATAAMRNGAPVRPNTVEETVTSTYGSLAFVASGRPGRGRAYLPRTAHHRADEHHRLQRRNGRPRLRGAPVIERSANRERTRVQSRLFPAIAGQTGAGPS